MYLCMLRLDNNSRWVGGCGESNDISSVSGDVDGPSDGPQVDNISPVSGEVDGPSDGPEADGVDPVNSGVGELPNKLVDNLLNGSLSDVSSCASLLKSQSR